MRARRLAFLIFVFVADISLDVAAIDLSSTPRLKATTPLARKVTNLYNAAMNNHTVAEQDNEERGRWTPNIFRGWFGSKTSDSALRYTQLPATLESAEHAKFTEWVKKYGIREEESGKGVAQNSRLLDDDDDAQVAVTMRLVENSLVDMKNNKASTDVQLRFFEWLRERPATERHAHNFLRLYCKENVVATQEIFKMWREKGVHPDKLFDIVRPWDNGIELWLSYTKQFLVSYEDVKTYVVRVADDIVKTCPNDKLLDYAHEFEEVHNKYLVDFAWAMQKRFFGRMIDEGVKPSKVGWKFLSGGGIMPSESDAKFRIFRKYTEQFAADKDAKHAADEDTGHATAERIRYVDIARDCFKPNTLKALRDGVKEVEL
ncbi:unnamed protein product [Hyaloperonospora brassicae]|uniref:RxLR effector candidate protein n=1 Tax=Hyaloperonospora brassicae TaxID=162125 RepID=A0AAV0TMV5_HYABA|nr:unnamed protein product [Hyaloperonospora brassicae]